MASGPEEGRRSEDPRLRSTHQQALPVARAEGFHGTSEVPRGGRHSTVRVVDEVSSCLDLGSMPVLAARRRF